MAKELKKINIDMNVEVSDQEKETLKAAIEANFKRNPAFKNRVMRLCKDEQTYENSLDEIYFYIQQKRLELSKDSNKTKFSYELKFDPVKNKIFTVPTITDSYRKTYSQYQNIPYTEFEFEDLFKAGEKAKSLAVEITKKIRSKEKVTNIEKRIVLFYMMLVKRVKDGLNTNVFVSGEKEANQSLLKLAAYFFATKDCQTVFLKPNGMLASLTFNKGKRDVTKDVKLICEIPVLLISDLDLAPKGTSFLNNVLFRLLNYRKEHHLMTILGSNLPFDQTMKALCFKYSDSQEVSAFLEQNFKILSHFTINPFNLE